MMANRTAEIIEDPDCCTVSHSHMNQDVLTKISLMDVHYGSAHLAEHGVVRFVFFVGIFISNRDCVT
jgi:hypothetical protein